jgi:hypothetical protein
VPTTKNRALCRIFLGFSSLETQRRQWIAGWRDNFLPLVLQVKLAAAEGSHTLPFFFSIQVKTRWKKIDPDDEETRGRRQKGRGDDGK